MIDERINQSLTLLEQQLRDVDSARKQVEATVNSYDGLKSTTANYVSSLRDIDTKLNSIISLVRQDYQTKVREFENDRKAIVESCVDAVGNINRTSEEVKGEVASVIESIQNKLKYSIALNAVIIIALIFMFIFK